MSESHHHDPHDGSKSRPLYTPPQHAHAEEGEGNWLVSYADMMTLLVGFFVILMSFSSIDEEKLEQVRIAATKEFGGTYRAPHTEMAEKIKIELEKLGLGDQFIVKRTALGVQISFQGAVFFAVGSADLKSEAVEIVEQLIGVIETEAKDYSLQIEGHTDNVPISGGGTYRNNWELSAIRAARVLHLFEAHGFNPKLMTAIGYGDARPVARNEDDNGNIIVANRAQNRRVVIHVLKPTESLAGVPESEPEKSAK